MLNLQGEKGGKETVNYSDKLENFSKMSLAA
jgi:hypothetical protein